MTLFARPLASAAALLCLSTGAAQAVFFHVGSGSIDGSLCVGNDCVASEAFGFDTIRLKENNLRLHFDDTSSTAGFANQDWRLIANDSASGGAEYFAIEDATASRQVFRVFANARANALVVDSQGDVGIGTATPATDIHVVVGDTPTLRLAQDGSSGFTAQTWDVAGNEAGFFIRDVTNGSALPFRIIPGASSQSLVIDDDDDIGIGAGTNPDASLHIRRSDGTAKLKVEETNGTGTARTVAEFINNGRPDLVLANSNTGDEWSIGGGTNMVMKSGALGSLPSAKTTHFTLSNTGNLTITGTLTTGGPSCGSGCDAVFSDDYDLPSISEHAAQMFALGHLPNVGPTLPGAPLNMSEQYGKLLNELEHAHIYIAQQDQRLSHQDARIEALMATVQGLQDRLSAE